MLFTACSLTHLQQEDEYLINNAIALYEEGRYGEALDLFSEYTQDFKSSDDIDKGYYYKGLTELQLAEDSVTEVLISNDYFKSAIKSFQHVSEKSNYYSRSLLNIGYSYYSLNSFNDARNTLSILIDKFSTTNQVDNACLYTGHCYRKELYYDTAIVWYEKIIREYKNSSAYDNALFWAGDYYFINRVDTLYKEKALGYLKEYCNIVDRYDPQYFLASNKIEVMENE